jgi:hypothetical protein
LALAGGFGITERPYGFTEKTPQGQNQQTQTAQEAALESSQEAHLAEIGGRDRFFAPTPAVCFFRLPRVVSFYCHEPI